MKRINRHRKFLQEYKRTTSAISAGWCCPLGAYAIIGFKKAERALEAMPPRWQRRAVARCEREYAQYHTPTQYGYSAAHYNEAMLRQ